MIGQHKRNLNPVPYQSGWKALYEREAELLLRALGENVLGIEHVGSTSIPGIEAKPVIDIMVAVESLQRATELVPEVEALGYIFRPNDTIPERRFFARESAPDVRTHHLNLTQLGSVFWVNQLAFRDYLRTHADMAAEYVKLKKHLAAEYERTKQLDRDGKTAFVTRVLALARVERGRNG